MFDLIIIGAGPAGYTASIRARQNGMSVALIEMRHVGGVCLNEGCIPTKTLLKSAYTFRTLKNGGSGIDGCKDAAFSKDALYENKEKIVSKLREGIHKLLISYKVNLFEGEGEIVDANTVRINGQLIKGKSLLIATGAKAILPPIEGINFAKTSREILAGDYIMPQRLAIIGGGVIGLEFANFFNNLGVDVTVYEIFDRVLTTFSEDVSKVTSMILKKSKIKFVLGSKILSLTEDQEKIQIKYILKEKAHFDDVDLVIACTGREAVLPRGLENTKVVFDKKGIIATDNKTAEPNIFAVGDVVKGNIQLAHNATYQALSVVDSLSDKEKKSSPPIPSIVYLDTEISSVGLTENQAREKGIEIAIGKHNVAGNGRSVIAGKTLGFIKVVFDKSTDVLIGVEIIADNAGEIIGGLSTLVSMKVTRHMILESCYPHPSVAEGFYEAVEDVDRRCIHSIYL